MSAHARTILSTDGTQVCLLAVRLEGPPGLVNGRSSLSLWLKDAKSHRYWRHSHGYEPWWLDSEYFKRMVGLLD
jgi:hypothetical protein